MIFDVCHFTRYVARIMAGRANTIHRMATDPFGMTKIDQQNGAKPTAANAVPNIAKFT